ncbi:M23 family metallopeptidase [Microbacterium sp. NPDC056052]|uniref:M23 family metallopeptidase n=1 Tax=Microbacterium sp. NPDC056052 TaxID=3345695 RepID=UPI0035E085C7
MLIGGGVAATAAALGVDLAINPTLAMGAGPVVWPNGSATQPTVTSPFGPRDGGWHYGTDFIGFSAIRAVEGGTVTDVGKWGNGGNQVWINHGGYVSRYLHMVDGSMPVSVGQTVYAGTILGTMGATGNAEGVHLHFEVDPGNGQIDPVPFLTARVTGLQPTLPLEDNMIKISSPNRGTALVGPGYVRQLTTQEEIDNSGPMVSASYNGNDRQFDLWRSMAVGGTRT